MIKKIDLKFDIIELTDFGRRPTTAKCISALLYLIDKCNGNIIEIGTWFGKTTYELAIKYPSKIVYTIDYIGDDLELDPDINRGLIKNKKDLCKYAKDLINVKFIFANSNSIDFNQFNNVDFIFIDGSHEFSGIKSDYEKSKEYLLKHNGGIIAFHDIRVGHTDVPKFIKYLSEKEDVFTFNNCNVGYVKIE